VDWQTRIVVSALVGVAAGAIGPRVFAVKDRRGGVFEYLPPAGFVEPPQAADALRKSLAGQRAWVDAEVATPDGSAPVVVLSHSPGLVQTASEISALVDGLPASFAASGMDWQEVRRFVHLRPDGVRVPAFEGVFHKRGGNDAALRVLQLAFPDDLGTSVVTASFPERDAEQWDKTFEATVDTAKGVAFHASPPPSWTYGAWGVGAVAATWIALSLLGARARARTTANAT
jgi:hypothetical protein